MSKTLLYSILKYSPSIVAGESINLGVLFCDQEENIREFRSTKRISRVQEFDDELDIESLKILLDSIRDDVSVSVENMLDKFNIFEFIRYYTNEFYFTQPIEIEYDDYENCAEEIMKIYLRFDYSIENRPNRDQQVAFLARVFKENLVPYKRNKRVYGSYHAPIAYDYFFEGYGIKVFSFSGKNLNKLFTNIKAWAWNCKNAPDDVKTLIFYSYDTEKQASNPVLMSILDILNSATDEVYGMEEGIEVLSSLVSKVGTQL